MSVEGERGESAPGRERLFDVVERFTRETQPRRRRAEPIRLGSRLDADLGLDSLARAELLARLERALAVSLPDSALTAETVGDLLATVEAARPAAPAAGTTPEAPPEAPVAAPTTGEPDTAGSLIAALDWHLDRHPERTHLHLYADSDQPTALSYGDLGASAASVAGGLQARGVGAGDRVALMLPTGRDYFIAFLAILRLGAVPVPIYPPARPAQLEEHLRRHGRLLRNAGARVLVTVPEARRIAHLLRGDAPSLATIATVADLASDEAVPGAPGIGSDDLALLQYTSGSTGDPKGVMLSQGQLLANIRAMGTRLEVAGDDVFVSWLPLYHDMGLIAAWLGSLYYAVPLVVMSPLAFLKRPRRWLEAIHRHRGTISGGPNFGYELCLRALDAEDLAGLDLGCWRVAFNGAEPVSPDTMERFAAALAPSGFRREALMPVYGLAEAAVGLCVSTPGRGPVVDRVREDAFTRFGRAEPAGPEASALDMVDCGPPLPGYEVRVVDGAGRELPDRREGDIEFRGPSATAGYHDNPAATEALRHGDWLRTGDRGYLAGGNLHVSGRVKDLIVRGGRNLYPYDLEEAIGAVEGVRRGCVAVFGDAEPETGIERLVVVAETRVEDSAEQARIRRAIEHAATDLVNVPPDDVRLVPPHSVLKTSSGKIRRAATRELYRQGRLGGGRAAVWRQLARLGLRAGLSRARLGLGRLGDRAYAAYAWGVFALGAGVTSAMVVILPRPAWRWVAARGVTRAAAWLAGIRVERLGLAHLPRRGPCVVVANHASYLDALVLTAALSRGCRHLAKRELADRFVPRVLLQRLGVMFVDRFDPRAAESSAGQLDAALAGGDAVAVFPEGTFGRAPGLRAFHNGAFIAAARAGVAVVPVALRGTRSLLRGSDWFPRPGCVRVTVTPPLRPNGGDWAEAVRLRDDARQAILAECGEPDLTA